MRREGPGLGQTAPTSASTPTLRLPLRAHRRQHRRPSAKATSSSSTSGAASTLPTPFITTLLGPASSAASPQPRATGLRDRPQRPRTPLSLSSSRPSPSAAPSAAFEADDAARAVIRSAGFAQYFTHRTGHNIAHEIHGPGAHLDNLETHDDRRLLPNTCFSVEPASTFLNSASAAKSTCSQPRQSLGHRQNPTRAGENLGASLAGRNDTLPETASYPLVPICRLASVTAEWHTCNSCEYEFFHGAVTSR